MRAFTLIEVMVALTLLGIIAVLLASGTRLSLDVSARGNARADVIRNQQLELGLLRNQLQGALPFRYWTEEQNQRMEHVGFDGESGRLRFVSRDGVLDGPNNLPRWVEWTHQELPNGSSKLVVEEHRIMSPDNHASEMVSAKAELMDCKELRFAFLDTTGEKPEWLSSWSGAMRKAPLPFAIKIQCLTARSAMQLLVPLDYADSARQGMAVQ